MATLKTRAPKNSITAPQRENLYKNATEWVTKSINEGFYLEAITLIESMIADRLESGLSISNRTPSEMTSLGALILKIKNLDSTKINAALYNLVTSDLDSWRIKRNESLHQMVKLEDGSNLNWATKVHTNKMIAKNGIILFRKIDAKVKIWTQQLSKNQLNYNN